jgi:hypothetical protein
MESIGESRLVTKWVEIPTALFIVAVAQRAEDKEEWFPRGKWATIQAIQSKIDREINKELKSRWTGRNNGGAE